MPRRFTINMVLRSELGMVSARLIIGVVFMRFFMGLVLVFFLTTRKGG